MGHWLDERCLFVNRRAGVFAVLAIAHDVSEFFG